MRYRGRIGCCLLLMGGGISSVHAEMPPTAAAPVNPRQIIQVSITSEPVDAALNDFARQSGLHVVFDSKIAKGKTSPAVSGAYSIEAALGMLLKSTGLTYEFIDPQTITIRAGAPLASDATKKPTAEATSANAGSYRVARTTPTDSDGPSIRPQSIDALAQSTELDRSKLDEVVVTGTHIRGISDSASPVEIYTRADIDATGANTVQQFLQTLPQNFNGGASENTVGTITGSGQTNNGVNGSAPNLRGLGADATLVLINGHRVAPGNYDGSFVDVSMIPLTAIERIEIVTDGASAIYGSDAVGGVVNIILRTQFDGAETRLQYGSGTSGSMHNTQAGQTVGNDWGSGSAVLSYQYSDQTPLSAGSREYLENVALPFIILPQQVQQAAFANINQALTSEWNLHGDLAYSHRTTNVVNTFNDGMEDVTDSSPTRIDGYSASLGSTLKISRDNELAVSATYSESDTFQAQYETPLLPTLLNVTKTKSAIISVDANLDGILASLPTGALRYAVGGQYRKETFNDAYLVPETDNSFHPSRRLGAGYFELRVPLVAANVETHGDPALQLTLADRAEHYSDFGSTNNPQAGMIWKPSGSVVLRGTYGTSFKAPRLSELNPVPSQTVIFPASIFTPAPGGTVNTLAVYGGNPDLNPEKATVWTVGLDFKPVSLPGFTTNITFYDIVFKDQITQAGASICVCNAFLDAATLGSTVLQRNPPSALVEEFVSQPSYANYYNLSPTTVGAIFDSRSLNLSTVRTRGIDFRVGYKKEIRGVQLDTGLDGTYILKFDNQFSSTSPVVSVLNTEFNPTDVRLRGREMLSYGPMSAGIYLNFVNGYTNNGVAPEEHVASWTTADAIASYQFGSGDVPFGGVSIALSVINLTGRSPPYLANPFGYGINFDGANANALGRYISLRLQKRW